MHFGHRGEEKIQGLYYARISKRTLAVRTAGRQAIVLRSLDRSDQKQLLDLTLKPFVSYLRQHVDEAGGQQDATAEAEQDRSDGPLPEVPLTTRVRRRQVHVGAQLEGQEAEDEGDATEERQRHDFHNHQVFHPRSILKH